MKYFGNSEFKWNFKKGCVVMGKVSCTSTMAYHHRSNWFQWSHPTNWLWFLVHFQKAFLCHLGLNWHWCPTLSCLPQTCFLNCSFVSSDVYQVNQTICRAGAASVWHFIHSIESIQMAHTKDRHPKWHLLWMTERIYWHPLQMNEEILTSRTGIQVSTSVGCWM